MSLTLLQPLQVPRPPRAEDIGTDPKTAVEGLSRWAATLSTVLNTFIQQVQEIGEAFITSPSSANLDTGVIQGYQLIITSALITVAAQIQDATITNAKIVSLTSDKIYLGSTSGNTLTTSGSTLILPGLLQISAGDTSATSIYARGTVSGIIGGSNGADSKTWRSLRIGGVEQYSSAQATARGITYAQINTASVVSQITNYDTYLSTPNKSALATKITGAPSSALIVLTTFDLLDTATGSLNSNLASALTAMGISPTVLEGAYATGGNGGFSGRVPWVAIGKNGSGHGSGILIFTNGSTASGPAIYNDLMLGNSPSRGSGAPWASTTIIEGGSIRTNTIVAEKLSVTQLSAIAADMGILNAGTIIGGQIISGASSGAYTRMGPAGVQVFDANGTVVASLNSASGTLNFFGAATGMTMAAGGEVDLGFTTVKGASIVFQSTGGALPSFQVLGGVLQSTGVLQITPTLGGVGALQIGVPTPGLYWKSINMAVQGNSLIFDSASLRPSVTDFALGNSATFGFTSIYLHSGSLHVATGCIQTSGINGVVQGTLSLIDSGVEFRIPFYSQG